jgi:hypothetical protein
MFVIILICICIVLIYYTYNPTSNVTTAATTTAAITTAATTTAATTTAAITTAVTTTPATTTAATTRLEPFHYTNCASTINHGSIIYKVDSAISRMENIRDNTLREEKPLSDVEHAFVMEFSKKRAKLTTITAKILREYFMMCRLEYRYTIIIEPNLSGNDSFDDKLIQLKTDICIATNAWYKPFIDLGLFPGHDRVDCICVEAIFKKDQHRLTSTEGVYISDQGDNRSSSSDNNALWWKKHGTFNAFQEYESYIQTKCPEESFIACRDAHSMQEIVYHTSQYKIPSASGTTYSKTLSTKRFNNKRYSRFVNHIIIRRPDLTLLQHEFGHSLFGMRDSLSDGGTNYNGIQYTKAQLKSIRPNTTCYGMSRGCPDIGATDIHCAAYVMLETLKDMKSQNGWIDGYMRL